ncbi:uncharacterized protein VTP21DRAFT_9908 [Calcarisporiella thermophila]|uniref:uncharacterized protein n=1 Tax=Calcarisporiella thermophila TaxID=911321 RepID=UPI003743703A
MEVALVKRPGYGRAGRATRVRTNYYELVIPKSRKDIYQYDVTIEPDVPPAANRNVFKEFEAMHSKKLGGLLLVFDGRKNAFSSSRLPLKNDSENFEVTLAERTKGPPKTFRIKIKLAAKINMEELWQYLNGQRTDIALCQHAIQALDVLIRHKPSMSHVSFGGSFFIPNNSKRISMGAEIWQGYYQSVRPAQGKLMLNVDVSHTAFHQSGPLIDYVASVLGRPRDALFRGISGPDLSRIERSVKGLVIMVTHRGEMRPKFKITKLSPAPADRMMFADKESGKKMNVAEYFMQRYNRRLEYPMLPCVMVRKDVFLPMEVCSVLPEQRITRKLADRQLADMILETCTKPQERAAKIRSGIDLLQFDRNEYLSQFGVEVKTQMTTVEARVLSTPVISYHRSSREAEISPRDGTWNMKNKVLAETVRLDSWGVVIFVHNRKFSMQEAKHLVREFCQQCNTCGLDVRYRSPYIEFANPQGDVERSMRQAFSRADREARKPPQLMLVVLPDSSMPLYAEVKRIGDTILGVPTQCMVFNKCRSAKPQYLANVILKVNAKLGGVNSTLSLDQLPFFAKCPTIILGADVNHPAPSDTTSPSIAAVCGTIDSTAARYATVTRPQPSRMEIIKHLSSMVKELLRAFYKTARCKPEQILFYRDGVSEGQFGEVMQSEISAIREACASLDKNYNPRLTFLVVQKRHHTRFFPMDREGTDRSGNCLPGTVVERTITHPWGYDFFIQSHPGLKGTSSPTHYYVLEDQNNLSPDELQELSYKLCYTYCRATRAVSLVPPAYYAHLSCLRARYHTTTTWLSNSYSSGSEPKEKEYKEVREEMRSAMYFV